MKGFLAVIRQFGNGLVYIDPVSATDPGYGGGFVPTDPGYGQGHPWPDRPDNTLPGHGHPGNALPVPPVRPSNPIVLPPGTWPPQLPPEIDNSLPPPYPGRPTPPIFIPPDPDLGIEQPIFLPTLPPGTALLIALPQAAPKDGPPNTVLAILVQSGKKPVLVYVSATPTPK